MSIASKRLEIIQTYLYNKDNHNGMAKKKQTFLLVSLSEEKTKKLANVITSDSARKILDYLATKEDATETLISQELKLPLSTVHYNLQQLLAGNLVEVDEFHYSKKGKEVNHYKLANKYIIIAPSAPAQSIRDRLKSLLPVALLTAGAAGLIQVFNVLSQSRLMSQSTLDYGPSIIAAKTLAEPALQTESSIAVGALDTAVVKSAEIPYSAISFWQNIALWFLIGALFALAAYFIIQRIRRKD